jgi:pheromone receptor transcription factor
MGRKKIEMELVKNRSARYVTFSKRKSGLFKKASELSILCKARVGIVGFTPSGNPFAFGTPNFQTVVEQYLHEGQESEAGSSRQIVTPSENPNINMMNKELSGLTKELKKVEEVKKGKAPVALADLNLKELLKVKASLKELHGDIEAASSLLLLSKKPIRIIDLVCKRR